MTNQLTTPSTKDRHQFCKYGSEGKSWHIDANTGEEIGVGHIRLCTWQPEKSPPAFTRAWGGAIDKSDCLFCSCFEPIPTDTIWQPAPKNEP